MLRAYQDASQGYQLFDVGSQGGTDFLMMEFLNGETLAERQRKVQCRSMSC